MWNYHCWKKQNSSNEKQTKSSWKNILINLEYSWLKGFFPSSCNKCSVYRLLILPCIFYSLLNFDCSAISLYCQILTFYYYLFFTNIFFITVQFVYIYMFYVFHQSLFLFPQTNRRICMHLYQILIQILKS